ncbi:MAG: G1 family glutamic endopeptidase [Nitrosotalea sp.]
MKKILAAVVGLSLLLVMIVPFTASAQTGAAHFDKPLQRLLNDNSLNWSGYYVTNSAGYTSAIATWTVPSVSTSSSGYSSAWVGIGGVYGTANLIQTGTDQDCTTGTTAAGELKYHGLDAKPTNNGKGGGGSSGGGGSKCTPTYYAWYEAYPAPEVKISNFNVSPGNVISASVQQASGVWSTTITNVSTGQTFTTTVSNFNPDQTSAEAIMERPALCSATCKLTNLADFGTIQFAGASATSTTSSTFDLIASDKPITMVDSSFKVLASPGTISNPGTFTDTWKRSS